MERCAAAEADEARARARIARRGKRAARRRVPRAHAHDASASGRMQVLSFKSPAEFFSENKNIAGFDNVGKCARRRAERPPIRHARTAPQRHDLTAPRRSLYTTVRELVENSLDACESIRALPDIEIALEEMDTAGLNRLMGVVTHERIDESLFERVRGRSRFHGSPPL